MTDRPRNHVTEALEASLKAQVASAQEWPEVPAELLLYLERIYPPRCYRADESVENHLMYAGAVGLVEDLRVVFEEQLRAAIGDQPDDSSGTVSVETPLPHHSV